jgi:hypothetical protein
VSQQHTYIPGMPIMRQKCSDIFSMIPCRRGWCADTGTGSGSTSTQTNKQSNKQTEIHYNSLIIREQQVY